MAAQAIWSGTISFSLVAIPVQLVKAVEPGRVSFRLLHSKDYSPLMRRMYCPEEETFVPPEEIVRGYEIAPERYVLVTEEELMSVSPQRSRTIEIIRFIDFREVDPVYLDRPYYLVPSKGGEKAYRLLTEVMRRSDRAGLARFVLADREHLVAIRSMAGVLQLITLHYDTEILPEDALLQKGLKPETGEKDRIKKSVRKMMSVFGPERYDDDRRRKIAHLLKKKVRGKALVEAPLMEEEEGEGPADLVSALQAIMHSVKKDR